MTTKTLAARQEELLQAARGLTPAQLVEALAMAIDELRAEGAPASVLQKLADARAKFIALAS